MKKPSQVYSPKKTGKSASEREQYMQRPHGKEYMMSIHLGEGGQQGEEGELDGHEAWWWGWRLGWARGQMCQSSWPWMHIQIRGTLQTTESDFIDLGSDSFHLSQWIGYGC